MRLVVCTTGLLLYLYFTCEAMASCAVSYSYSPYSPYYAPVKKVEKIVAEIAPVAVYFAVPVTVPVYGGSYNPPTITPVPATSQPDNSTKEILDRLKAMEQEIKSLRKPAPTSPSPPADPFNPGTGNPDKPKENVETKPTLPDPKSVLLTRCAVCHEEKVSKVKGDGFTMFKGTELVTLKDRDLRNILTKVSLGKMPPKKTGVVLKDDELASLVYWVEGYK